MSTHLLGIHEYEYCTCSVSMSIEYSKGPLLMSYSRTHEYFRATLLGEKSVHPHNATRVPHPERVLREGRVPCALHAVFKQCASHLHHEANVEQIFSLAGRLSDPNLDPHRLPTLVRIHFNKKRPSCPTSRPSASGTSFRKYRKAGQSHDEEDEVESDATAEASAD